MTEGDRSRTGSGRSDLAVETFLASSRTRIEQGQPTRNEVLELLAELLAQGSEATQDDIFRVLRERETLLSTGLGEGVAIPHAALASLREQRAAFLIVPQGVDFNAIDDEKVRLFVAVVGPKTTSGEHLRMLARLSRLFRNRSLRERLLACTSAELAYQALVAEDQP